jgi:hypothetical protein
MPVPKWPHLFAVFFSALSLRRYATTIARSYHRSILSTVLFCHRSWINRDTKIPDCCCGQPKQAGSGGLSSCSSDYRKEGLPIMFNREYKRLTILPAVVPRMRKDGDGDV